MVKYKDKEAVALAASKKIIPSYTKSNSSIINEGDEGKRQRDQSKLTEKYFQVYRNYELEKTRRLETENALQNLWTVSERKHIAACNNQALKINTLVEKNKELDEINCENITKLNDANDTIHFLKQLLTQEKRKADKLNIKPTSPKQPVPPKYSLCTVFKEEVKAKENALEKVGDMSEQILNIETEQEETKKKNRELKTKLLDIVEIKTELEEQNKTLTSQSVKLQSLLKDKDIQIKKLVNINVLEHPSVLAEMRKLEKICQAKENKWTEEIGQLNENLEEACKNNTAQQVTLAEQEKQIINFCRDCESLKLKKYYLNKEVENHIWNKQNDVLAIDKAINNLKTELIQVKNTGNQNEEELDKIKEELRVKNFFTMELLMAKKSFEEQIAKYRKEVDGLKKIAQDCEAQIQKLRLATTGIAHYKNYAVERQLKETNQKICQQKINRWIQKKTLEENEDTIQGLISRLEGLLSEVQKCQSEEDTSTYESLLLGQPI